MRPAGRGTLNFLYLVIKSDYSDIALQHNFPAGQPGAVYCAYNPRIPGDVRGYAMK
jgi:hypothetical protein